MAKKVHEVRDAVHVFVEFDDDERRVIDSPAFQRLRHIHQLALTYMVYPGASHARFEHSLGVMHLAGRIYDTITRPDKVSDAVRSVIPDRGQSDFGYWRTVLRIAALCHDLGHLPFSHAGEDLLPAGVDHERITWDIVHSEPMEEIFRLITPPVRAADVGKLAIGPRHSERLGLDVAFNAWEAILAEVIVGDAFGADRMDYLLRDSLHLGVAYGRFDHDRLIGTLRVVPSPPREQTEPQEAAREPVLGCERGGLHSAEQLLLARYFMFSQVYFHPTRLAYNEHLQAFLREWLDGTFPSDVAGHLSRDDNDVLSAIKEISANPAARGHAAARRIIERNHFKVAYTRSSLDEAGDVGLLVDAARQQFGSNSIAHGRAPARKSPPDFAVFEDDGRSVWASGLSDLFSTLPDYSEEFVLADAEIRPDVRRWLEAQRERILDEGRAARVKEAEETQ